mmetsp:Transcript_10765/g.26383  ORF Transcript_10765/g.26383 Transcript_10765/m.26383 type:complete len:294 (+) Transcript_10765:520-1401(+)
MIFTPQMASGWYSSCKSPPTKFSLGIAVVTNSIRCTSRFTENVFTSCCASPGDEVALPVPSTKNSTPSSSSFAVSSPSGALASFRTNILVTSFAPSRISADQRCAVLFWLSVREQPAVLNCCSATSGSTVPSGPPPDVVVDVVMKVTGLVATARTGRAEAPPSEGPSEGEATTLTVLLCCTRRSETPNTVTAEASLPRKGTPTLRASGTQSRSIIGAPTGISTCVCVASAGAGGGAPTAAPCSCATSPGTAPPNRRCPWRLLSCCSSAEEGAGTAAAGSPVLDDELMTSGITT